MMHNACMWVLPLGLTRCCICCVFPSLFFAPPCTFLLLLFVFVPEQSAPLQQWRSLQLRSRRGASARLVFG